MELKEIYDLRNYQKGLFRQPKISFEVFPPKDGDISKLFEQVRILKKYNPSLISITYGANGGNRDLSFELIKSFLDLELDVMPHFTCVCSNYSDVENHLRSVENLGIENILALRGDIPQGVEVCDFDFKYANELVDFICRKTTLAVAVAGYPEGHIEASSLKDDIENLKRKVDAGASAIYTQLFFDNEKFYNYVELVKKSGIDLPVIPGIMPVRSIKQLDRMTSLARIEIPEKFKIQLEKFPQDAKKIGTEFAISQCQDLMDNQVLGLHFFTLNNSDQTSEILDNIL